MIKIMSKNKEKMVYVFEEERVRSTSPRKVWIRTNDKNLESETETETMKKCCSLTCSHGKSLPYIHHNHLPKGGNPYSGLGLPTSIINLENISIVSYRSV